MADVVFVALALAFFALCVLYVRWCDLIIGPDEVTSAPSADDDVSALDEVPV
jgi:hypothetical protein